MPRKPASPAPAKSGATTLTHRQRLAATTRARIFKTAIREFADKGFSGARVETIATRAKVNIRMIYHYFGGKEALYIEVLEHVLANLRDEERKLELDVERIEPVNGILQLYDFTEGHFAAHPELLNLLSSENLNRARFLKRSKLIPKISSPVLDMLRTLIERGEQTAVMRTGIDALHLYVLLVSLCYFHKSNAFTISRMFDTDMLTADWQAAHKRQAHEVIRAFLVSGSQTAHAALSIAAIDDL
ncbi:TetR/AcrR family transcriptional regulator [Pararobbsia silviterrae]|uniref:TetR/AcrR family transcriptional regulator n=1 Tax=Pararobbsia silviterrae TaxID=1792498 RepID=A0A494XRP9_9BURK|nr:TetR/AcrR family transcriptional regulator [Pararobbsia silviterrae]RKP50193.1 TetR/AcrR family transcriptional regulator [Pararobbsia silviterrae]